MRLGTQRSMHCPCGRDKILAHGLCATCYTLRRQDDQHFWDCAKRFWKGMDTDAGCAMRPAETSGQSSFITGCPGDRSSTS